MVRIVFNHESCLRLVTALAVEVSEGWVTGRRYLDMEELREHPTPREARRVWGGNDHVVVGEG